METLIPIELVEKKILLVRGEKVMLSTDLAELYGVNRVYWFKPSKGISSAFRKTSCFS